MTGVLEWMLAILGASLFLGLVRLVRGPGLADRVVALDLLAVLGVSLLALFALLYERPAFLDVAVLLGLVGFISSVALARAMDRPKPDEPDRDREGGRP